MTFKGRSTVPWLKGSQPAGVPGLTLRIWRRFSLDVLGEWPDRSLKTGFAVVWLITWPDKDRSCNQRSVVDQPEIGRALKIPPRWGRILRDRRASPVEVGIYRCLQPTTTARPILVRSSVATATRKPVLEDRSSVGRALKIPPERRNSELGTFGFF